MSALAQMVDGRAINVRGFARAIGLPEMKMRRVIEGTSSVSSALATQIAVFLNEPMGALFEEHPVKGGWYARTVAPVESVA